MKKGLCMLLCILLCVPMMAWAGEKEALGYLQNRLHQDDGRLWVYHDFSETVNHFTQKALISDGQDEYVFDLDEDWRENPHSGASAIRCHVKTKGKSWGGWMFMNGYLEEGEARINWGILPDTGMDVTGATCLRFFARGETGEEKVQFFLAGTGYNEWNAVSAPYPDSNPKIQTGFITLGKEWTEYEIALEGCDVSSLICGFGFVVSAAQSGERDSVFYLDDIRFEGELTYLKNAPRLMASYDTDNIYLQSAAFSYDNALCAMAFMAAGDQENARVLMDAFVYAVEHDRFSPDRIRNAYAAGDLRAFPGWGGGTRLPGWYDAEENQFFEDRYQVGTATGNMGYVALALLQYHRLYGGQQYLALAQTLMDFELDHCQDGADGFTAGYDGWPESRVIYTFPYKSIEHNLDVYAAMDRLYELTGDERYAAGRDSALRFVQAMYDQEMGCFHTGTGNDGITPSKENIVLDAQVWSALALKDFAPYMPALETAFSMQTKEGGYPFHKESADGGTWLEGTAFTALAFQKMGMTKEAEEALALLSSLQRTDGGFPAATVPVLETGFDLFTGEKWTYSDAPHIAPAAWYVMAVYGFNPYAFE